MRCQAAIEPKRNGLNLGVRFKEERSSELKVQAIGIDCRKDRSFTWWVLTDRVTSPGRSDSHRPAGAYAANLRLAGLAWKRVVSPITLLAQFVRAFVKSNRKRLRRRGSHRRSSAPTTIRFVPIKMRDSNSAYSRFIDDSLRLSTENADVAFGQQPYSRRHSQSNGSYER